MTNKHTSVGPDGSVATRNSKSRIYTHAVWVRHNRESAVKAANKVNQTDVSNYHFYRAYLDGTSEWLGRGSYEDGERYAQRVAKEKANAEQALAGCDSLEAWLEMRRQKALAVIEAINWDEWDCVTWCGSRALAEKQKSSWGSKDWIAEAVISEVKTS